MDHLAKLLLAQCSLFSLRGNDLQKEQARRYRAAIEDVAAGNGLPQVVNFAAGNPPDAAMGATPDGWTVGATNAGVPVVWTRRSTCTSPDGGAQSWILARCDDGPLKGRWIAEQLDEDAGVLCHVVEGGALDDAEAVMAAVAEYEARCAGGAR